MIGTRQMSEIIQAVNRAGGKVVIVGDSKQLQSIEAGRAFKAIRDTIGSSRLILQLHFSPCTGGQFQLQ